MSRLRAMPAIADLSKDDLIWRLDWLGDCGYPMVIRRYGQPSIKAVFSPLACDKDDQAQLLLPSSTDHHHQKEVWLAISALTHIDRWKSLAKRVKDC